MVRVRRADGSIFIQVGDSLGVFAVSVDCSGHSSQPFVLEIWNIFHIPPVTHPYGNHQIYLHAELRKIRWRSPDKHLPSESALFPHVRWRGFADVVNDHQPPGPLGPHQGRRILRLGGIPDIVYLRADKPSKVAADRDLHDLLQDALGYRGRISFVAGRRTCGLTRRRNGPHLRLGARASHHRAVGIRI